MRVQVVRHVSFEDVGHLGTVLEERGHTLAYAELGEPIELAGAGALVLMGGPMSANDPDPWVESELEAVRRAVRAEKPVLGICLGAQVLARALGAAVTRNPVKEIGWYPVRWRPEAADDPLFHSLSEPATVFHWHGETFGIPEGAVLLASSDRCAHQAFRYGRRAYGLQFHPEVTPAMISDWCRQDVNCGDIRELDAPIDPEINKQGQEELSRLVFGRWAATFL